MKGHSVMKIYGLGGNFYFVMISWFKLPPEAFDFNCSEYVHKLGMLCVFINVNVGTFKGP